MVVRGSGGYWETLQLVMVKVLGVLGWEGKQGW